MEDDHKKEQLLHKIIASSAFLFALSILPVAQYFLVNKQLPKTDSGQVAGVETVRTLGSAPQDEDCTIAKDRDLTNLEKYLNGVKTAYLRDYEEKTAAYQGALLNASDDQKPDIQRLIDTEYKPYMQKLTAVQSAVDSQKKEIESRSCLAE